MNNKLPVKYGCSFTNKIKRVFFSLFNRENKIEENKIEENKIEENKKEGNTVLKKEAYMPTSFEKEYKKLKAKEEIIELLERDPKMIESFSDERIEMAISIYKEKTKNNRKEIARLNAKLGNV